MAGVTVTCANVVAAAEVMVPSASGATVNWSAVDMDSPNAKVNVGYVVDNGNPISVTLADVTILAENLPLGAGTYTEDLTQIGSGKYRLVVVADDDENGAVIGVSDVVITVDDKLAPAVPVDLSAVPQAGELARQVDTEQRARSGRL